MYVLKIRYTRVIEMSTRVQLVSWIRQAKKREREEKKRKRGKIRKMKKKKGKKIKRGKTMSIVLKCEMRMKFD